MTEHTCSRPHRDVRSPCALPKDPVPRWLRVVSTWLVIFPTVTLGQASLAPFEELPLVLRSALLTAVAVPFAAYIGVPAVFSLLATRRPGRSRG